MSVIVLVSGVILVLLGLISASKVWMHFRASRRLHRMLDNHAILGDEENWVQSLDRFCDERDWIWCWVAPALAGLYFGIRFILGI